MLYLDSADSLKRLRLSHQASQVYKDLEIKSIFSTKVKNYM